MSIDYQIESAGLSLRVQAHHAAVFEIGAPVSVRLDPERCAVIRQD